MVVDLIFGFVLTFLGMLLASKLLGFHILNNQLAIVAAVSTVTGYIPTVGWIVSLASVFFLLRQFSNSKGLISMVIISWLMSVLGALAMADILNKM